MSSGRVVSVLGSLVKVSFEGKVSLGEIGLIELEDGLSLKGEVIGISSRIAKMQVFEDSRGIMAGSSVVFAGSLLEVELGPGLLSLVFDGLQNPLENISKEGDIYLRRGYHVPSIDRGIFWDLKIIAKVGDRVVRGDVLGVVPEGNISHKIMVPFKLMEEYEVVYLCEDGAYCVDHEVAHLRTSGGEKIVVTMLQKWPVKIPLIEGDRVDPDELMVTGLRVIDSYNPIVKGGTATTPGPFGAGKTVIQQCISKFSNVDIVVLAACGERAGEVVETLKTFPKLVDPLTKKSLMDRTVIICNTSSMPVAAREASVYFGITIAEYYRQMGLDALLLADSTSRWAQAMREISGNLEEIPGEEAFPAYLSSRIASFYERSGVVDVKGCRGSVTIIGAVSPSGGNFSEPVTQSTLNVVGNFSCLSRDLSDRRIYPSIDPIISWSKYLDQVSKIFSERMKGRDSWKSLLMKARSILEASEEIGRRTEVVGMEGVKVEDIVVHLKGKLFSFAFLQQNAFDNEDAYCSLDQQFSQFMLINDIFDEDYDFKNGDEAQAFFIDLQFKVKGLNYLEYPSKEYDDNLKNIEYRCKSTTKR